MRGYHGTTIMVNETRFPGREGRHLASRSGSLASPARSSACHPRPEVVGRRLAMHAAWAHTIWQWKKAQHEQGGALTPPADATWQPDACEPHTAGGRSVERNRTLWIFGNSVSRIHLFAAHAILRSQEQSHDGVSNVSILDQVTLCGKGGEWHGKRPGQGTTCDGPCSCSLEVPGRRLRLRFVWQQKTYDKVLAQALVGNYSKLPVQAGDTVLINTGLDGAIEVLKRSFTRKKTWGVTDRGKLCEFRGNFSFFEGRWRRELAANARLLSQAILAAWKTGRRVFWRTSTRSCSNDTSRNQIFSSRKINQMLEENDAQMTATLQSFGIPVVDMLAIDRDLNGCPKRPGEDSEALRYCRCRGFLDHTGFHPGPQLASRQIARLLSATDSHCLLPP
jgi:hypothetical protein